MPETLYRSASRSLDGSPAAAEKAWTRVIELEKESRSPHRRISGWQISTAGKKYG